MVPAVILEPFVRELRLTARRMRRDLTWALVVVLSLALGIGSTIAVFRILDQLLLQPLPVRDPGSLVLISPTRDASSPAGGLSHTIYQFIASHNRSLLGAIASAPVQNVSMSFGTESEGLPHGGVLISGNYFRLLGLTAQLGRVIEAQDDEPGAAPVAVLSFDFWRRRFGRDASIVGKTVRLNAHSFTIVGVAPRDFRGVDPGAVPDVFVPLASDTLLDPTSPSLLTGDRWALAVIGRLAPGVDRQHAAADLTLRFREAELNERGSDLSPRALESIRRSSVGIADGSGGTSDLRWRFATPVRILMAMATVLLLLAASNVTNIFMARAVARRPTVALRLAMGAGARHIASEVLTESILLSLLAGAVGSLLAYWGDKGFLALLTRGGDIPALGAPLDMRSVAFALTLSVATGVAMAVVPLRDALQVQRSSVLKGVAGVGGSARRRVSGQLLVLTQVMLSLALVIAAAAVVRSLRNLSRVDLGFDSQGVLLAGLDPRHVGYTGERLANVYGQLVSDVAHKAGVEVASIADDPPFSGALHSISLSVDGTVLKSDGRPARVPYLRIGKDYFRALHTPLRGGREFLSSDDAHSRPVAIVTEVLADHYFGRTDPIGRQIRLGGPNGTPIEIVGIVRDSKLTSLREAPRELIYLPFLQDTTSVGRATLVVRANSRSTASVGAVLRAIIGSASPSLDVSSVRLLHDDVSASLERERIVAWLATALGAMALGLAGIGIYGMASWNAAQRTLEIGIRVALGAQYKSILRLAMVEVIIVTAAGVLSGVVAGIWLTRSAASLLYGLGPTDVTTIAIAVVILGSVAVTASFLPARRAARGDPVLALQGPRGPGR